MPSTTPLPPSSPRTTINSPPPLPLLNAAARSLQAFRDLSSISLALLTPYPLCCASALVSCSTKCSREVDSTLVMAYLNAVNRTAHNLLDEMKKPTCGDHNGGIELFWEMLIRSRDKPDAVTFLGCMVPVLMLGRKHTYLSHGSLHASSGNKFKHQSSVHVIHQAL